VSFFDSQYVTKSGVDTDTRVRGFYWKVFNYSELTELLFNK